jgi:hypothetical protein
MVVAVIPTSLAGTVPVGAADADAAADEAGTDTDEVGAEAGADVLLVLAVLQPAATSAATATAIRPARRVRPLVLGLAPPRGGCS